MEFQPPDYRMNRVEDWFSLIYKRFNPKMMLIAPIVTLPFMFYRTLSIAALLVLATICLSYVTQRAHLKRTGIELVTFTTVVIGVYFGAVPGALVGLILLMIHDLITHRLQAYLLVVMPMFGLIGALAGIYSSINILLLGLGLAVLTHVAFMIFQTITHKFPERYLPYLAVNLFFNGCLFYAVAPWLLRVF